MTAEDLTAGRHRIVVVESHPFWGSELRRRFLDEPIDIQSVLPANVEREIPRSSPEVVVLEAGPLVEMERVLRLGSALSSGVLVVILPVGTVSSVEWSLREFGAATVVNELIGGERLAAICRRYLQCQAGSGVQRTPRSPERVS
ncbi:hypothetical protein Mal4_28330 [Maioricimonas rarisocia]|uniref:Response regulatory domain-containing protein n=1 Tax=Maioricimonas rarisocia TaxID=2528026 RepID=A0A517Z7Q4_9PLAN|nr:hypothetical protein [Maioricimonas rarisocia]QDU38505.1 hypothetical protein Mal4_28330 [Maioricimonas rarisocia]